jgi:antirestriction protein ArdC
MSDLNPSWQKILHDAITQPGSVHEAYSRFHNYSIGNQLLALFQCHARGLQPGPLATFPRWKELGRHVRKGEKALTLCQPITVKRRQPGSDTEGGDAEQETTRTCFVSRPHWFVLAQTEGADYQPEPTPKWDKARALAALAVEEVPFDVTDGNMQGFASKRTVAISPIAVLPHKTLFHEPAHVVLGHTSEGELSDSEHTPKSLREVEAEAVALLCCESLGLAGAEFSRGYIQSWLQGESIPERSARRIFHVADQILKAGEAK